MEVKSAIKELLFKYTRVVIPGIGAFYTEYEEAELAKDGNTFIPPGKSIHFDATLSNAEDALIAKYIARNSDLSHEEAQKRVDRFIEKTQLKLNNGEEVIFPHIGSLLPKKGENIRFIAQKDENFLLESYGFDAFQLEPKKPIQRATQKNVSNYVIPTEKTVSKRRVVLLVVVLLIFLSGSTLFLIPTTRQAIKNTWKTTLSKSSKTNTEDIIHLPADTSSLSGKLDEQTRAEKALAFEEDSSLSKYAGYTEFIIVAGSFSQYKNAENLRSRLVKKGLEPVISLSNNKFYRVSIQTFSDRRKALQAMDKLEKEHSDLKLWLLSS